MKLSNSSEPEIRTIKRDVISYFVDSYMLFKNVEFKFVVKEKSDIDELLTFSNQFNIDRESITIMPCCTSSSQQLEVLRQIKDRCLKEQLRLLPRLHILIWENKRGV